MRAVATTIFASLLPSSLLLSSLLLGTAVTGAARAEISHDVVKLGVLSDMTGPLSQASGKGSVTAVEMAVSDYGGSVKGKTILVISADHQNNPDAAATTARNWLENEQVDAILGVAAAEIAAAVAPLVDDRKKVLIRTGRSASSPTRCAAHSLQWTHELPVLAEATALALVGRGHNDQGNTQHNSWLVIPADDEAPASAVNDVAEAIRRQGGQTETLPQQNSADTPAPSLLAQARAAQASVAAIAGTGSAIVRLLNQEEGPTPAENSQKLLALTIELSDAHALGLQRGQGLLVADGFYWDSDDGTRAFARAFFEKTGRMPTTIQAALYSATQHYLKAIDQTGSDEGDKIIERMKSIPVDDFFARNGRVMDDGRMAHGVQLFELKAPEASNGEWDLYRHLHTVAGSELFSDAASAPCPSKPR